MVEQWVCCSGVKYWVCWPREMFELWMCWSREILEQWVCWSREMVEQWVYRSREMVEQWWTGLERWLNIACAGLRDG